jgi:predicted regulator of Ras-like GTPase activity (Roadblock/LC7/MglB family)
MDYGQAIAELVDISSQVELALVFDSQGRSLGSTLADADTAESLAQSAASLLAAADDTGGEVRGEPMQVELTYPDGSILVVRRGDLGILALTSPDPIAQLVFFDLGICLEKIQEGSGMKRRLSIHRPGRKTEPRGAERKGENGSP